MERQFPTVGRNRVDAFGRKHRTGLVTLLFTDMVGSTALKRELGDKAAATLFRQHHRTVRELLKSFPDAEEIETAGDSFFLVFATPSAAVHFSLMLQAALRSLQSGSGEGVRDRIGVHVGEVVMSDHDDAGEARDVFGIQIDTCSRVMSLGQGGQVLMTRSVFDSARQVLKGEDISGVGPLEWLNHGPYLLKGLDEAVEICEVRDQGQPAMGRPANSEKAQRQARPEEEPVLGWRPAVRQLVPNTRWQLERKLGEGGFGEVWLGRNPATKEARVFKFCFQTDRIRFLKRELTLFRVLKERIGEHPNIVRLHDVYLDHAPYYVEMDYVEGADLRTWTEQRGGIAAVPLEARLEIVAQAADGLQAAHEAGIIHRDIKPANILIAECGPRNAEFEIRTSLVRLTDFGIGQVVSEEALKGITGAGFTQTLLADSSSSRSGTQLYMAPELLAGKPASIRSDIYSLGVVLYQLLVADFSRPVTTDWAEEISDRLLREDLKHCFAGNPQDRFVAAGQLARHLRTLPARRLERSALERAAYRRGILRTGGIAFILVSLISTLAIFAVVQSKRAKAEAARAQRNLYDSLLGEARATRIARVPGYRARVFDLLRQARDLRVPGMDPNALRCEASQCLGDFLGLKPAEFTDFTADILRTALDSAGRVGAFALSDSSVLLRNLPSGETVARLKGEPDVRALTFGPAGDQLVSVNNPDQDLTFGQLCVWSKSGDGHWSEEPTKIVEKGRVWCLSSVKGLFLCMSGGASNRLQIVDLNTRAPLRQIECPEGPPQDVALSADHRFLALAVNNVSNQFLRVIDLAAGREDRIAVAGPRRVGFSLDGRHLACLTGLSAQVYDTEPLALVASVPGFFVWTGVVFASEETFAVFPLDTQVRLWDWVRKADVAVLSEPWKRSQAAIGRRWLLTSGERSALLYPVGTLPERRSFHAHEGGVSEAALTSDGTCLATSGQDGRLNLWEVATGLKSWTITLSNQVGCVAFGPADDLVVCGSGGRICVYNVHDGTRLAEPIREDSSYLWSVRFSGDGKYLAAVSDSSRVEVWTRSPTSAGGLSFSLLKSFPEPAGGLVFAPRSARMAFASGRKAEKHPIYVWDLATMPAPYAIATNYSKGYQYLTWMPDGQSLLKTDTDQAVVRLDALTGKEISRFPVEPLRPAQLKDATRPRDWGDTPEISLSPDGRLLALRPLSATQRVDLFDRTTGRRLYSLREDAGEVWWMAWSGNSQRLAIARSNGDVQVWHVPEIERLLAEAGFGP